MAENLLWIDCEFTGFSVEDDLLLEIAAISTDDSLKPVAQYNSFIGHDCDSVRRRMAQDDWWPSRPDHRRLMLKSVGDSSKTLAQVDGELSEFADQYCTSPLYMAGNSPYKDRAFVERDLPDLHSRLHHRMLDVSSFKIVGKNILNTDYPKREQHRALDDLFESIDEFNFLLRALGNKSVVEFLERRRSF